MEARLKTTKEILTRGVKVEKGNPKDLVVIESAPKEGASTGTGRGIGAGARAQKSSTNIMWHEKLKEAAPPEAPWCAAGHTGFVLVRWWDGEGRSREREHSMYFIA